MRNQMTNVLKCVRGMWGQLSGDVLWKKNPGKTYRGKIIKTLHKTLVPNK